MSKPAISREQFIVEVNQRLPNHHAYRVGWRVFLFPEGADPGAVTGWSIEPRSAIGHIRQVTDHVFSLFAIDPPFPRDPHD
ncbi:hypothetical protein ABEG10_08380 [Burkholderia cenocepacia]|uniref:hypothetical protein n=1 Tax=Burkholderia cenocepacia TaxID=95486 RepID=UPI00209F1A66|nr:hypothetical protein [Burkholderia cenocepacia]MCO8321916.1 hypothetical protein [Burkholderia cenocepacia]MCO8329200.1 hypothetical protein [Burkholderia cenocepacia]MCO8336679.1 hypothetical protein [Burkholderia cenocepacia]MCO8343964.1 hypothetical protein [Burkholderia cenocepacia]MCO8357053.1 hypothetical protein [Burkholderia cenocepacia]